MVANGGIIDLTCQWPERLAHGLKQNNHHFYLIEFFIAICIHFSFVNG